MEFRHLILYSLIIFSIVLFGCSEICDRFVKPKLLEERISENMNDIVYSQAKLLENYLIERENDAIITSKIPTIINSFSKYYLENKTNFYIEEESANLLLKSSDSRQIQEIYFIDNSDKIIWQQRKNNYLNKTVSEDNIYFLTGYKKLNNSFGIESFYHLKPEKKLYVIAPIFINESQKGIYGKAVLEFNLKELESLLEPSKNLFFYLINEEKEIIISSNYYDKKIDTKNSINCFDEFDQGELIGAYKNHLNEMVYGQNYLFSDEETCLIGEINYETSKNKNLLFLIFFFYLITIFIFSYFFLKKNKVMKNG